MTVHVAFVIKSMNTAGGGAERVLADVSNELARRGHKVAVVTYDGPGEPSFYPLHKKVALLQLGIGRARNAARVAETVRRIGALRDLLQERRPDVVVGFMHSVYVPLAAAMAGTGIPLVASEHMIWNYYDDRRLEGLLLRLAGATIPQFTIPLPRVRESFPSDLRSKMVVIPNPVRPTPVDMAARPEQSEMLLSVGRLEPQKDQITLIRAFALLAASFPSWRLKILGEGHLRPLLEAEIAALGLQGRVLMPGATTRIMDEYRSAGIFVLPSRFESFGLVTGEALAAGLPAVGFADCSGTNEIIADGDNGLLVRGSNRVAALADALAGLMGSPSERARLGAAGRRSMEQFALAPIIDQWEDLLRDKGRPE